MGGKQTGRQRFPKAQGGEKRGKINAQKENKEQVQPEKIKSPNVTLNYARIFSSSLTFGEAGNLHKFPSNIEVLPRTSMGISKPFDDYLFIYFDRQMKSNI